MFIQVMSTYGYMFAWIIYFIVFTLYLNEQVNTKREKTGSVNIDTFFKRFYGIVLMNIITAIVLVTLPILLIVIKVKLYWITLGVIVTLVIYIGTLKSMKISERLINRDINKYEIKQAETITMEQAENKVSLYNNLFWLGVIISLGVYALIILDAWEIVPITTKLFPPMMPIALHMILDWLKVGVMLVLTVMMLILAVYRKESHNVLDIKKQPTKSKKNKVNKSKRTSS